MGVLIYDYTVPSNTSSVVIPNLNIQKGELYEITGTFVSSGDSLLALYYNNNITATNYWYQRLVFESSSSNHARSNSAYVGYLNPSSTNKFSIYVKLANTGYGVSISKQSALVANSGTSAIEVAQTSTFTMTSINSLTLSGPIATGSRIQLRKIAEKVAEFDIASATTSVTFDNLNILKEDEYLLAVDGIASAQGYSLYANNDKTATNYWRQLIQFFGSSSGGNRVNSAEFSSIVNRTFSITNLKLSNIGHFTFENFSVRDYGSSNIMIDKRYGTKIAPTNAITRLDIVAETNGIGAGSRFELYKLYEAPREAQSFTTYELLYDSDTAGVSFPTTQIDIPNLNITKDDELRLVYTIKGNTTVDSYAALFVNDNTNNSDYHAQLFIGTGSSLIAVRQNLSRFTQFRSNAPSSGTTNIKISNNDKVVWQDQHVRWIGSAAASLENNNTNGVTSGLTISNITKLSIVASETNEIGTGSRIRLYKVNKGAA